MPSPQKALGSAGAGIGLTKYLPVLRWLVLLESSCVLCRSQTPLQLVGEGLTSSGQQTMCHLWVEAKNYPPTTSISSSAKMALEAKCSWESWKN